MQLFSKRNALVRFRFSSILAFSPIQKAVSCRDSKVTEIDTPLYRISPVSSSSFVHSPNFCLDMPQQCVCCWLCMGNCDDVLRNRQSDFVLRLWVQADSSPSDSANRVLWFCRRWASCSGLKRPETPTTSTTEQRFSLVSGETTRKCRVKQVFPLNFARLLLIGYLSDDVIMKWFPRPVSTSGHTWSSLSNQRPILKEHPCDGLAIEYNWRVGNSGL